MITHIHRHTRVGSFFSYDAAYDYIAKAAGAPVDELTKKAIREGTEITVAGERHQFVLEMVADSAERWNALMRCGRLRVLGYNLALGTHAGHLGLELWAGYPDTPGLQAECESARGKIIELIMGVPNPPRPVPTQEDVNRIWAEVTKEHGDDVCGEFYTKFNAEFGTHYEVILVDAEDTDEFPIQMERLGIRAIWMDGNRTWALFRR